MAYIGHYKNPYTGEQVGFKMACPNHVWEYVKSNKDEKATPHTRITNVNVPPGIGIKYLARCQRCGDMQYK